jgi:hypothetical protein
MSKKEKDSPMSNTDDKRKEKRARKGIFITDGIKKSFCYKGSSIWLPQEPLCKRLPLALCGNG